MLVCEMCGLPASKRCWICSMDICVLCTRRQHWKVGVVPGHSSMQQRLPTRTVQDVMWPWLATTVPSMHSFCGKLQWLGCSVCPCCAGHRFNVAPYGARSAWHAYALLPCLHAHTLPTACLRVGCSRVGVDHCHPPASCCCSHCRASGSCTGHWSTRQHCGSASPAVSLS